MPELKPCPFCGGAAKFVVKSNKSNNRNVGFSYKIECSDCGATPFSTSENTEIYMRDDGVVYETEASKVRKGKMIEAWNRRVKDG